MNPKTVIFVIVLFTLIVVSIPTLANSSSINPLATDEALTIGQNELAQAQTDLIVKGKVIEIKIKPGI